MRLPITSLLLGGLSSMGFMYPLTYPLILIGLILEYFKNQWLNHKEIFCFFFALHFIGSMWLQAPIHHIAHVPWIITLFLITLLATICASIYVVCIKCLYIQSSPPLAALIQAATAITLAEWIKSHILGGYPFLLVAYSLVDSPFQGWIPVFGLIGASWTILMILGLTAQAYSRAHWQFAALFLSIGLITSHWVNHITWTKPKTDQHALLMHTHQPYINPKPIKKTKFHVDNQKSPVSIIVWPESGIDSIKQTRISGIDSKPLIIHNKIEFDKEKSGYFNTMIGNDFLSSLWNHRKYHLAQFNEWIPDFIRSILRYFHLPSTGFLPGSNQDAVWTYKQNQIGAVICYEMLFSDFVEKVGMQSNYLVNINDLGWFEGTSFYHQFDQIARFMALLIDRPILMSSNLAATQLINHKGKVMSKIQNDGTAGLLITFTPRIGNSNWFYYRNPCVILIICLTYLLSIRSQLHRRLKCFNLKRWVKS